MLAMEVSTPGAITMADTRIDAVNILAAKPLRTMQGLMYVVIDVYY